MAGTRGTAAPQQRKDVMSEAMRTLSSSGTVLHAPDAFALYTKPKHTKNLRPPLSVALGGKPAIASVRTAAEAEALIAELCASPLAELTPPPGPSQRRNSRQRDSDRRTVTPYQPEHVQRMAAHASEVERLPGELVLSPEGKLQELSSPRMRSPLGMTDIDIPQLRKSPQSRNRPRLFPSGSLSNGQWASLGLPSSGSPQSKASGPRMSAKVDRLPPEAPPVALDSLAPYGFLKHYRAIRSLMPEVIVDDEADFASAQDRLAMRDTICSAGYILGQDADFVQKVAKLGKEVEALNRVNQLRRKQRCDDWLLQARHFLPALPTLFLEAVRSGSDWWAELCELRATVPTLQAR